MAFGLGSFGGRSRGQDAATVYLNLENGDFNAKLDQTQKNWVESMQSMTKESIRLELASRRLVTAISRHGTESSQAKRALLGLREAEEAAARAANQTTAAVDRQGRSMGSSLRRIAAYTGGFYLLGRAFTSTVQIAGEFQRAMNILEAVTKATAAQMAAARAEAVRLGKDITLPATSAKDAADAMTTLAKAGLDVRSSIAGSEGVLRLAAAAQIETADAANITARSLNAFGLEANQSARVADVFAAAANAATGEIPDFALALSQASNVAKSWNLSIEDTVATLAVFANNAIIGSDAGTSLRVMLTRLTPISKAAADEMNKIGVSAFDAGGKLKPYRQIIQEYHDALVKLGPEEQKQAIRVIFGQDAQRAANVILLHGVQAYDKMREAVAKQGAAQELAAARNKGYLGSLDAFKSAIETLQISIGTQLLPTLTKGLQDLTGWVNHMEDSGNAATQFQKAVQDANDIVRGFVGALKTVKSVLSPIVNLLGGVEEATKAAFGIWLILRLRGIAAGLGVIQTRAYGAAAGFNAMAAAEGRATAGGFGGGAIFAGGGALALEGYAAVVAAQALHARFDDPNTLNLTPQQTLDFISKNRARLVDWLGAKRVAQMEATARMMLKNTSRASGAHLPVNYDDVTQAGGGGGGGGGGKEGLTQLQRLQLASLTAETTKTMSDDLRAARALEAYYRRIASNENLKGKALFDARQDYLNAVRARQSVEDQIASDRQQAEEKAAAKRKAAAEKLARYRAAQAKIVAKTLTGYGPYANTSSGFNKAGVDPHLADRPKGGKGKDGITAADVAQMLHNFMVEFDRLPSLAGNIQLTQNFHTQSTPDPSAMARGARYLNFHMREALVG